MPSRAMSGAGMPAMSRPSNSIRPEAGGTSPVRVLSSVDLPAPLRPSSATISPSRTSSVGVVEDVALAVEGVDLVELQHRRCSRASPRAAGHRWRARAGVDLLHATVGANLVGRTRHQHLALVHHRDALREAQHTVDVVLHDEHRDVAREVLAPDATRARARPRQAPPAARRAAAPAASSRARCPGRPAAARHRTGRRRRLLDALEAEEFHQLGGLARGSRDSCRCRARR